MKFVGNLGKFEDLESFDSPFEFQSKMNPGDQDLNKINNLPNPNDAFDLPPSEDNDDIPF
jgi:replicative DNA helicase